jgi:predicted small metal-binding protein
MLELRCAELGMACRGKVEGRTREELLAGVAEHASKRHGVHQLNQTLVRYVVTKVKGTPEEASA